MVPLCRFHAAAPTPPHPTQTPGVRPPCCCPLTGSSALLLSILCIVYYNIVSDRQMICSSALLLPSGPCRKEAAAGGGQWRALCRDGGHGGRRCLDVHAGRFLQEAAAAAAAAMVSLHAMISEHRVATESVGQHGGAVSLVSSRYPTEPTGRHVGCRQCLETGSSCQQLTPSRALPYHENGICPFNSGLAAWPAALTFKVASVNLPARPRPGTPWMQPVTWHLSKEQWRGASPTSPAPALP